METDRCILLLKAICQGQKKKKNQPRIGLFQAPREMLWFNSNQNIIYFCRYSISQAIFNRVAVISMFFIDVSSKDALLTGRSIVQTNLKKTVKNIIPNKTKPIIVKMLLIFFFQFNTL